MTLNRAPSYDGLRTLVFDSTHLLYLQFARYVVVGGAAFLVDFSALYLLTGLLGLHYLLAAAIAFILGLTVNYLLSCIWVFDRHTLQNPAAELIVFTIIGVVGLGFNEAIIWFVIEKVHWHYMIAKLISSSIVLFWNFGARRYLLFR